MSNAEWYPICFALSVVVALLYSIRGRLKRIEDKLDKLGK
jgi:hypothetical protein